MDVTSCQAYNALNILVYKGRRFESVDMYEDPLLQLWV